MQISMVTACSAASVYQHAVKLSVTCGWKHERETQDGTGGAQTLTGGVHSGRVVPNRSRLHWKRTEVGGEGRVRHNLIGCLTLIDTRAHGEKDKSN